MVPTESVRCGASPRAALGVPRTGEHSQARRQDSSRTPMQQHGKQISEGTDRSVTDSRRSAKRLVRAGTGRVSSKLTRMMVFMARMCAVRAAPLLVSPPEPTRTEGDSSAFPGDGRIFAIQVSPRIRQLLPSKPGVPRWGNDRRHTGPRGCRSRALAVGNERRPRGMTTPRTLTQALGHHSRIPGAY